MYILKVAYDGRYSFQSQPHRNTVVDVLMDALKECGYLKGEKVIFSGGRTDKGVSALGNFIVVELNKEPILSFIYSKLRGKGIWVLGYREIDDIPRVKYRHYRYILPNEGYDIELMREASKKLIGTHSFHNLSKKDRSKERSPIRTIYDIKIEANEYFITIDVIGESFLWNMVRKIVTALSYVGSGKKPVDWIDKLLDVNYREGVPPSPPEGLILIEAKVDVEYIYDDYVLRRFREEWEEEYKKSIMKIGICKSMLNFFK
jgi:tRNA pseudouridine38-40 synthase